MIRVATWNLWCRHGNWQERQPAIFSTLATLDADIVGLQEVSSKDPDHVAHLRSELGYHTAVSPDEQHDRWGIANVIASRWPIISHGWQYLDVGDMPPHRTVLWAHIDAPVGDLMVYCTHLSHGFDNSALRQRQLTEICELIVAQRGDDNDSYPPILIGDLNAVPESDEIRRLTGLGPAYVARFVATDAWAQRGDGVGATYSSNNPYVVDSAWPERRLDYVMSGWPRPRPKGNPVSAERFGIVPVDGVVASDHYGVIAELAT
ncbi:MAG: endonuclease/exonuclease/phosphatase family protein [Acidimicrobiaceae bacterium]|jgi:endonuclease/exonuclease/phosphatase family metal-dependent hydrolase